VRVAHHVSTGIEQYVPPGALEPAKTIHRHSARLIPFLFILISIIYLAQLPTPLRLINDALDYLSQASSAIDGHGFQVEGNHSMRPPGYPALIYLMGKMGIANSWTIVALNCVFLGVGCWVSYFILRDSMALSREAAQIVCLLTLLSFLMVRNVTYPLSDVCFFGASTTCVLVLKRSETQPRPRRFRRLIFTIPLLVLCIELRTVGIVLIPPFLWAAIGGSAGARQIYPTIRRHRLLTGVVLMLTVAVIGKAILESSYMQFNAPFFLKHGIVQSIVKNIGYHTAEWGEMALNAPLSKLPATLGTPVRIVGGLAIFAFLVGVWIKGKTTDALLLYVIGSACMVFPYPWLDARLWLPVFPFLLGYALLGLRRMISTRALSPVLAVYCSIFCLMGMVALGYSTRLTYAGPRFPEIYGDGNLRGTYKAAFLGEKRTDVNSQALYLLRRYDSRAVGR
jgi:hypothetical protein